MTWRFRCSEFLACVWSVGAWLATPLSRALTADPALLSVTMMRALGPSCPCMLARCIPMRHMTMGHATVTSGVDIPSDVVAAALKWHDVQRQRCEKKSAAFYDSVVMRRKGPSRKDKRKYNKGYAKEQERQNERKLLVQKWVWEEQPQWMRPRYGGRGHARPLRM